MNEFNPMRDGIPEGYWQYRTRIYLITAVLGAVLALFVASVLYTTFVSSGYAADFYTELIYSFPEPISSSLANIFLT